MKRLLSAVYSVDPLLLFNTCRVTARRGIPEPNFTPPGCATRKMGFRSQMSESEWFLVPEAPLNPKP